jgi:acyl-coenzyme A synthetase/AMP-(fatty) acid ligase
MGTSTYHTRRDDMIISSGYNISGLEVENVLAAAPRRGRVRRDRRGRRCARSGCRGLRGSGKARPGANAGPCRTALQEHVRQSIAPYKYPRIVRFIDALPRNESGKVQRFRLRKDVNDMKKVLQPAGWKQPKGYANGILAHGRMVFTGGMIGWNAEEDVRELTALRSRPSRR